MSDAQSLPVTTSQSPELVSTETDYRQITDALMQTQRGRRFLAEHARRCRQTQQADLLAALARLERAIAIDRGSPEVTKLRADLAVLTHAVERVRTEVVALRSADRRRPQDEEVLRLLREQSTRLDGLADIWTHAHGPAPPASASAPQSAVEITHSNGAFKKAQGRLRSHAVSTRNGSADGSAGTPYGAETLASDLLRQTPIFDLAFDSRAATEPMIDAVAASEAAADELIEYARSDELDEPAARVAIVQDTGEHGAEAAGGSSEHHPEKEDDLPAPASHFAVLGDAVEQGDDRNSESSEHHPEKDDHLPGLAVSFAIEPGDEAAGGSLEHHPDKRGSFPEPEQQLHTPEVSAAETPTASIAPEAPSASATAESLPDPVADEPPFASAVACDSPAVVAAPSDPLAPLYALSEEERIALFT